MVVATQHSREARFSKEGGDRFTEDRSRRMRGGKDQREKDREREPGETKVGQWPGHVEKNGAQRAGQRHTVLLIHRPLLAAPGSVHSGNAARYHRENETRFYRCLLATLPGVEKEIFDGKAK